MDQVCAADELGALERAPGSEDREARAEPLLLLLEQVVAPGNRCPEGGVAWVGVSSAAEKIEPIGKTLEQLLGREEAGPRGG